MRPIRVLMAVSAAALVAAACGDDSTTGTGAPAQASGSAAPSSAASSSAAGGEIAALDAPEILTRAKAAFTKAESVRLAGGGDTGGQKFTIDMRYATAGNAIGSVSNGGQKIELRRIGQTVYLKADKAFWSQTAGAAAAELLGGKYLKAPLTDPKVAQLATFTDKNAFISEVLDPEGSVTKGEVKDVRGTPAIGLIDKSKDSGGTLYVATTGEPLPLQLSPAAGGGDSGQLDFLDYGKGVEVPVPPAAETIDVTKLGK